MIWPINRVGKLYLVQSKFKSWKLVQTWMVSFFINENNIGNRSGIRDGVYKSCFAQFVYLIFDDRGLFWLNGSFILENGGNNVPCVDTMFNNRWIKPRNLGIGPSKDITKFLKNCFVWSEFLRGARSTKGNIFNHPGGGWYIEFNGWWNVGHVTFFKGVRCRDWIFKQMDTSMDEVFCFDRELVRRSRRLIEDEEGAMVKIIPRIFRSQKLFKYLLIIVKVAHG